MTLDDVLGALTAQREGEEGRSTNPSYDSGALLAAAEASDKLQTANIRTAEGLEAYKELTGDDVSTLSAGEVGGRLKLRQEGSRADIAAYATEHIASVTGELSPEMKALMGFSFAPQGTMEWGSDEFKATREKAGKSRAILEGMEKDRKGTVQKHLAAESELLAHYAARDPQEYAKVLVADAQRRGPLVIAHYGAEQFLTETRAYVEAQVARLETEGKRIDKEMSDATSTKEIAKGDLLSALEQEAIVSPRMDEMKTLGEECADAKMMPELVGETLKAAIQTMKQKAAEAAAATPNA